MHFSTSFDTVTASSIPLMSLEHKYSCSFHSLFCRQNVCFCCYFFHLNSIDFSHCATNSIVSFLLLCVWSFTLYICNDWAPFKRRQKKAWNKEEKKNSTCKSGVPNGNEINLCFCLHWNIRDFFNMQYQIWICVTAYIRI